MKKIEIVCLLHEHESYNGLDESDMKLLMEAQSAMRDAYAPYSQFNVGAALLLENGTIVRGNNQENASYPVGLCAERVAIFHASAVYPGVGIKAIAISAYSKKFIVNQPVPPCGACRQAIAEYEVKSKNNIRIIMAGESGKVIVSPSISNLLPFQFNGSELIERSNG